MTTAARLFECSLDAVLLQLPLQLKQRLHRAIEVSVNCHPLCALGLRVDRIQIDGDVAIQVHAQYVHVERLRRFRPPIPCQVVRDRTIRQGLGSLHPISTPVYEQAHEVVCCLPAYTELRVHCGASFLTWCVCTPAPKLGQIVGLLWWLAY